MIRSTKRRQIARQASRSAALFSAVMLLLSMTNMLLSRDSRADAAVAGSATIGPDGGGGASETFTVNLPDGAACSGDNTAGYTVQSYMVPSSVEPSSLVFGATGPTPVDVGVNFRRPLTQASNKKSFVNQFPDVQTGAVSGIPGFTLSIYTGGLTQVPAGTYNVGIACVLGGGDSQTLDKYWNGQVSVAADTGDALGFRWDPAAPSTTTTTLGGSTTTTLGGSTTTTLGGSTTTTLGGSTTTTLGGSTTTTLDADVLGSGFTGGAPSAASPVTTAGQLPYTGSSPLPMLFWAVCLLVFGRFAMLLGKRPRVIGDHPPE